MLYKEWIEIKIEHAFFEREDRCGLDLIPSEATDHQFKKGDVLWRKKDPSTWMLLKSEPQPTETDRTPFMLENGLCSLVFQLKPLSSSFYGFTCMEETKSKCWQIVRNREASTIQYDLKIQINNPLISRTERIKIRLPTKEYYWTFILIPKHTNKETQVSLIENNSKLAFTPPEAIEIQGKQFAFRCTSTEKVALKEMYDYQISLLEKKNKRERILYHQIPFPKTNTLSSEGDNSEIMSYVYY